MPVPEPIFTVAGIRELEKLHIAGAVPSLMERAGRAAAEFACSLASPDAGAVLVLAGPGNNGGDGFVIARRLLMADYEVTVVFAGDPAKLPADARAAFDSWIAAGGQVVGDFLPGPWALAIDALFGIGLARAPNGIHADWIERFNRLTCPRLAVDIPSGLDADTGRVFEPCVRATHTISFIARKPGLLTLDGPDHCGEVRIADLGLSVAGTRAPGRVLRADSFAAHLKPRPRNSHKGSWGEVGIIGGAPGMLGAALLAGRAALQLGAGRVFVGCIDASAPRLDPNHPELMLRTPGDLHAISSVLAIGPGLGKTEAAGLQLRRAMEFQGPLVLDADALNLVSANPGLQDLLTAREAPGVLTPHPAEAGRLLQLSTAAVQADRVAAACAIAARFKVHVVLKGNGSVVAHPDGHWSINTSGHPGMAAAGMGDVLTGLVASLLGQGWPADAALEAAVHLHGAAADLLASEGVGPIGVGAGELIPAARRLLNRWIVEYGTERRAER
jgi:hydroxyethylthiazole kinase-like uncharacterized protein yjeF